MSISTDYYRNLLSYTTTEYGSVNHAQKNSPTLPPKPAGQEQGNHDSLQLSVEYTEHTSGEQAITPTGTYSRPPRPEPLTTDQEKSLLSSIQQAIAEASTSSSVTGQSSRGTEEEIDPLSELQNILTDFDASVATDEEVSELFDQVMELMESLRPQPPMKQAEEEASDFSGIPSELLAMNGMLPPFVMNLNSAFADQDNDSSKLSTEDKRILLSELSELDTAATDEEIGAWYEELTKLIQNSTSSTEL
ncbi:hypothetical protein [Paenibacillus massiliensis]|uniref:hypothetical protein n=1 Tax=Paenibacillus massiliensis TaxID=225917 RepID=UPI00046F046D|nr:hypothetical protein [Paenibacillus massiliensis]